MGPEDTNDYTLFMDGVLIAPGQIELPEITVTEDAQEPENAIMRQLGHMEFTMHLKTPKSWRCRSRKRFIKLLMSKGIGRNQAASVARAARIAGVPYGELWRSYFFWGEDL